MSVVPNSVARALRADATRLKCWSKRLHPHVQRLPEPSEQNIRYKQWEMYRANLSILGCCWMHGRRWMGGIVKEGILHPWFPRTMSSLHGLKKIRDDHAMWAASGLLDLPIVSYTRISLQTSNARPSRSDAREAQSDAETLVTDRQWQELEERRQSASPGLVCSGKYDCSDLFINV